MIVSLPSLFLSADIWSDQCCAASALGPRVIPLRFCAFSFSCPFLGISGDYFQSSTGCFLPPHRICDTWRGYSMLRLLLDLGGIPLPFPAFSFFCSYMRNKRKSRSTVDQFLLSILQKLRHLARLLDAAPAGGPRGIPLSSLPFHFLCFLRRALSVTDSSISFVP
jgi:hypothetical protein